MSTANKKYEDCCIKPIDHLPIFLPKMKTQNELFYRYVMPCSRELPKP
ncbi:hypothetical protein [Treponema putidum]|nr:hypothetical protein [Treponema putidum]